MSRKIIKKQKKCTGCGAEAGLLLITLPSNVFRRPRTEAELKEYAEKVKLKTLTLNYVKMDQKKRQVRYCPDCIKAVREKFGHVQNKTSEKYGEDLPVGLWGQR